MQPPYNPYGLQQQTNLQPPPTFETSQQAPTMYQTPPPPTTTPNQPGVMYPPPMYSATPTYGNVQQTSPLNTMGTLQQSLPPTSLPSNQIPSLTPLGMPTSVPQQQSTFQAAPLTGIQSGISQVGAYPPQNRPMTQSPLAQQQPQTQTRSPQRINPAQIPSPTSIDIKTIFKFNTNFDGNAPPSATAQVIATDQGNCNPRFMRMTQYTIPLTHDQQSASGLPFGVVVQPFAELQPGETAVPVVDVTRDGPQRCQRCRAYINPFVKFVNGGKQYVCKICDFVNEVSKEYFAPLDAFGRRTDLAMRPELVQGSVDFAVTGEYVQRELSPPLCLFALDVSANSLTTGMLHAAINSISTILNSESFPSAVRVGFLTYDTSIHFYNLHPSLQQAQMMVIPDLNEVFLPLSQEVVFVKYSQSKSIIDNLLQKLPTMFQNTKTTESAFGAALQAGEMALKPIGGKLVVFQSSLPTTGPGKLKKRDDPHLLGTDKEKTLYQAQDPYYTNLALDCAKSFVCVDLFLFPHSYIDVATIGSVPRTTGGQVYLYPGFNYHRDLARFHQELARNLTRQFGYDGVVRMRTSSGLGITNHVGNFNLVNGLELHFAGVDSDQSFVVQLKHEEKLDEKFEPLVQCALLYTTSSGERRVRVHNLALMCTSTLSNVFRAVDCDAVLNYVTRVALAEATNTTLSAIRSQLIESCTNMLSMYRKHCATPSSSGQLILPEALKYMPIYVLCLLKNTVLRTGSDVNIDERSFLLLWINGHFPPSHSTSFIYPRMYALHQIPPECGVPDHEGNVKLPPLVRLSQECLTNDGAYLLEDGLHMFLWLGRELPSTFLSNVFGVQVHSVDQLNSAEISIGTFENEESSRINAILATIRRNRHYYPPIQVVKSREPLEPVFLSFLYEDKGHDAIGMNYVDFLCHIHKQIQTKLND